MTAPQRDPSSPPPGEATTDLTAAHDSAPEATASTAPAADRAGAGSPELPDVPGFAVARELARGGMGAVYLARDPALDRPVAVKVMHWGQDAGRFVVEAKVTAQLPHPGVPPVHALGELPDGRPFLAMKLIDGRTLADELRAPGADRARLLVHFERVCEAVGFAHARGIVHRDLKPANVMVGAFGEVQVMDWGLAKDSPGAEPGAGHGWGAGADPGFERTLAGQVKGTPAYMAPEQARGEPVDARADVFALGGILAAILTGKPPFAGGSVVDTVRKAAAADLSGCFSRLGECGADPELVALARKCLAADPADRFSNGKELADAVAAYRAGVEERLRVAEREQAAAAAEVREQRKRRAVQRALAAAGVLLLVAAGGFAWQSERRSRQEAEAEAERSRFESEQRRLDGERQLAEERAAGVAREARSRNGAEIGLLVERCENALRERDDAPGAAAALAEVDRRLPGGGHEGLADRVARCRADLTALQALDRVDADWWLVEAGRQRTGADNVAALARALAALGLAPGPGARPEELAARVRGALVAERLVGALDLWLVFESDAASRKSVRAVLAAADPHPFRDRVRDCFDRLDHAQLLKLTADPQFLEQLPRLVIAVCSYTPLPIAVRRTALEQLALRRPDHAPTLMTLAAAFPAGSDASADARLRWYQSARALRPADPAVLNNLGVALNAKGETDAAIAHYRAALKLNDRYAPLHNNLGTALAAQKDFAGAIPCFREAVRLDPNRPESHFNLGMALRLTKDLDGALGPYREAARLNPKLAPAHAGVGLILSARRDFAGALEAFEQAAAADPGDPRYRKAVELTRQLLAEQRDRTAPPPREVKPK